jgi:hypothetical protein
MMRHGVVVEGVVVEGMVAEGMVAEGMVAAGVRAAGVGAAGVGAAGVGAATVPPAGSLTVSGGGVERSVEAARPAVYPTGPAAVGGAVAAGLGGGRRRADGERQDQEGEGCDERRA